ncbi:hypothetical protein [Calidifontibacillus erzurumensis]|uniref:hypothetical protein n=1 Tax=Calidifontibacillus erzurumensis TaxID=2741433 RepID=UPI0035B520CB
MASKNKILVSVKKLLDHGIGILILASKLSLGQHQKVMGSREIDFNIGIKNKVWDSINQLRLKVFGL